MHSTVTSKCKELIELLNRYGRVIEIHDGALLIEIDEYYLHELSELLHWKLNGYYTTSIGVDERPLNGSFGVYHAFVLDDYGYYVILYIKVSTGLLKTTSITPVIPGANWAEREIMDFLGIRFIDHPEPYRLILPFDWPDGIYPLRKDFPYNCKVSVKDKIDEIVHGSTSTIKDLEELSSRYTLVPIGPYHPALHEPEYFELYVDGEKIVDARYKGFMVHRGMEKLAESRLTYNQIPFLAERICGICGFTHNTAYCQAVENAAGIDVPERALFIRSLLLELERIHSHLLWFGVAFHLLGFDTGFMITWRLREDIMNIAELLTGNRKTYGMNLIGGVRRDVKEENIEYIKRVLKNLENEFRDYMENIFRMNELVKRTKEIGILSKEDARKLCVLGPHARASGLKTDVRKYHPYAAYKYVDFQVPVRDEGDVLARLLVRYEEILESINIINQLLDNLPNTPLLAEYDGIPEKCLGVGVTEAPRGEDFHFVITGRDNKVYRWRPRAPSYNNLQSVPLMLRGEYLADAPIIIASIDPCFSCTDHVIVVDVRNGTRKRLSLNRVLR